MVRELAEQAERRMTVAALAANSAGALVVFVFATVVLPVPPGLHDHTRMFLINAGALVVLGGIAMKAGWAWSRRLWAARMDWAETGRDPTARERELPLRYPLSQQALNAKIWIGIVFLLGFMASYMTVLSWADYSYVMPVGAFGYALLTLLAVVFLHEHVTPRRWVGVMVVCIGVLLVGRTKPSTTETHSLEKAAA